MHAVTASVEAEAQRPHSAFAAHTLVELGKAWLWTATALTLLAYAIRLVD